MSGAPAEHLVTGAVLLGGRQPALPVADPEFDSRDNWRMPTLNTLAAR